MLRLGRHSNKALQADWDIDGAQAFHWEVLQLVGDQEQLLIAEETHILRTPIPYNANERAGTGPKAGYRHTEASKLKMSRAQKGRKKPEGFGLIVSRLRRGHRDSPETKAKRIASYLKTVAKRQATLAARIM